MSEILIQSRKIHPQNLPIRAHKAEILYGIDTNSTLIILAETGSGKTTQIPQYLSEAGYCGHQRILVSLPRRMAAISIAQRVSDENGTEIGQDIGYRVRFDTKVSESTKIEYVTDGAVIQMIMSNPLLEGYSVVMLDDIHERTTNTDLLVCLVKKIQKRRPELRVIISSATLQVDVLKRFFENSQILYIKGRNYEVEIFYLSSACRNYVIQSVELVQQIHKSESNGDILVFLTSIEEINSFIELMAEFKSKVNVLPLYANLPIEKQLEVFKQSGLRKIIASTNIAESSVTIDGIVYVIDCCQQKIKVYDHKRNLEQLNVVPISQQQSQQRAGRAGRTRSMQNIQPQDGACYRLCTREEFSNLPKVFPPEILRSNLTDLVLQIRSFSLRPGHLQDLNTFLTPVSLDQLVHPINTLLSLQLMNNDFSLTELGSSIVDYPLEYKLAICVENSFKEEFQCSEEMLKIASVLSVQGGIFHGDAPPLSMLKAKKALGCKEGDILSLHNIFVRYMTIGNKGSWCDTYRISRSRLENAGKIYKQLQSKRNKRIIKSSIQDVETVLRCLLTGFFMHVAQRESGWQEGVYRNIYTKQLVHLHAGSVLTVIYPEWVIYYELIEHQNRLTMNQVSEIDPHWLFEIAPHFYQDVRKQQAEERHKQDQLQMEVYEKEKIQKQQQDLFDKESKIVFGSFKQPRKGFNGFIKPSIPIKDKEYRVGSVKNSNLSFEDEDM